jgi:uncharacterized protein (DUF488 family)
MLISTIGYEGSEISDFVSVLKYSGVEALVDIRDLPSSRKPGFSKNSLSASVSKVGIDYIHVRPLGDPREGRLAARAGNMIKFRKIFCEHIRSPEGKVALNFVANLAKNKKICLMCFERDHKLCHRNIVVEELLKIRSLQVSHIGVPKGFSLKAA